jgi:hypothetical protein
MTAATEKSPDERAVPVSQELAEEGRKWLEPPPPPAEPRREAPRPARVRSVRYDLD